MPKKFILVVVFFKNLICSLFPIVKMKANYAETCRVGNFEADFQQLLFVHFLLKFSQCCCEAPVIQIQQRKVKNVFLDKNFKKSLYLIKIA